MDYLVLTFQDREWSFEYRSVKYDFQAALQALTNSGFIEGAGPMGWLILDEVLSQRDHLMPFLTQEIPLPDSLDETGWEKLIVAYLDKVGRWETVKSFLSQDQG